MKKRFGIFWMGQQREIYGNDSYYTLGTLMGIVDTEEEAEEQIRKMKVTSCSLLIILPVFQNII